MIGACKLADYEQKQPGQVSFLSVNKAKGLDSLAVILIDVRPLSDLRENQDPMDYSMEGSRARQLPGGCAQRLICFQHPHVPVSMLRSHSTGVSGAFREKA